MSTLKAWGSRQRQASIGEVTVAVAAATQTPPGAPLGRTLFSEMKTPGEVLNKRDCSKQWLPFRKLSDYKYAQNT